MLIDIPEHSLLKVSVEEGNDCTSWVVDSGCTQFMCNQLTLFDQLHDVNVTVKLGDSSITRVHQAGDVFLFGSNFCALYVPSFRVSLISVPVLDRAGFTVTFANDSVLISNDGVVMGVAKLESSCGLYVLDCLTNVFAIPSAICSVSLAAGEATNCGLIDVTSEVGDERLNASGGDLALMATTRSRKVQNDALWKKSVLVAGIMLLMNRRKHLVSLPVEDSDSEEGELWGSANIASAVMNEVDGARRILGRRKRKLAASLPIWHARLGHISDIPLRVLLKNVVEKSELTLEVVQNFDCDTCGQTKAQERTGHGIAIPRSLVLYERIHSDVCGPISTPTLRGCKYYAVFVEDSTRWGEVSILLKRSDLLDAWINFRRRRFAMGFIILMLRSDNGGEFKGLEKDLREHGIVWERSPPYTQHANGVSERYIRSMNTKARAMMQASHAPSWAWAEAITVASYVHRLIPQRNLDWRSPFSLMFGTDDSSNMANLKHLRVFGCVAYRWLHPAQRKSGKWVARANPGMFLGYGLAKSIYRVYDFVTREHHECSSVSFRENLKAWPLFGDKNVGELEELFDGYYELSEDEAITASAAPVPNDALCVIVIEDAQASASTFDSYPISRDRAFANTGLQKYLIHWYRTRSGDL